jgi:hypothetical protein
LSLAGKIADEVVAKSLGLVDATGEEVVEHVIGASRCKSQSAQTALGAGPLLARPGVLARRLPSDRSRAESYLWCPAT